MVYPKKIVDATNQYREESSAITNRSYMIDAVWV